MSDTPTQRAHSPATDNAAIWTILGALLLAMAGWVGHHELYLLFSSNERRYFEGVSQYEPHESNYVLEGVPAYLKWSIQWNYRLGMLFAGIVVASLLAALKCAYHQVVVWQLRRNPKSLAVFSSLNHIFFGPFRGDWRSLSSVVVCLIAWLTFVALALTPFSISQSKISWPQPQIATATTSQIEWSLGTQPAEWQTAKDMGSRFSSISTHHERLHNRGFDRCNYTAYSNPQMPIIRDRSTESHNAWKETPRNLFPGALYGDPSDDVWRAALDFATTAQIASDLAVASEISYDSSFYGPAVRCAKNPTQGIDRFFEENPEVVYHSWVPNSDNTGDIPTFDPAVGPAELDFESKDIARLFIAFRGSHMDDGSSHPGRLYECGLYNASYIVSNEFNVGAYLSKSLDSQVYGVTSNRRMYELMQQSRGRSATMMHNITYLNPMPSLVQTVNSENQESIRTDNATLLQFEAQKAYMAMMHCLGRLLVGSVTVNGNLSNGVHQPMHTSILNTKLRNLVTSRSNMIDEPAEGIQHLMAGTVVSMLADPLFTTPVNRTVTIWKQLYFLHYEPLELHIPYAIIFALVLVVSIAGLCAHRSNGTSFFPDLTSVVLASTEIERTLHDAPDAHGAPPLTGLRASRLNEVRVSMVAVNMPNAVSAKVLAKLDGGNGSGEPIPLLRRRLKFVFHGPGLDDAPMTYGSLPFSENTNADAGRLNYTSNKTERGKGHSENRV